MEDFTKEFKQPTNIATAKQISWLTKNRLWNLIFLFTFPIGIFFAAVMWSLPLLLIPLAILIFVFKFAPVDKSAVTNREPQAMKAVKCAGYIWFFTTIAFGFAGSKILSLIGIELGQFGFGEVAFFIFLIPISILCYANIPLSSCIEAKDSKDVYNSGSRFCVGDSRVPYTIRSQNFRH
jgi:hypothetical protein